VRLRLCTREQLIEQRERIENRPHACVPSARGASVREDCAKQRPAQTSARNLDGCRGVLVFFAFAPDDRVSQTEAGDRCLIVIGSAHFPRRGLVSTKAEEQDAGAAQGSESAESADVESAATLADGSVEAPRTLPSIIVDPGLSELSNGEAQGEPPEPAAGTSIDSSFTAPAVRGDASFAGTNGTHVPAAEPAEITTEPSQDATPMQPPRAEPAASAAADAPAPEAAQAEPEQRFSDEDAERFAANFRPSWEPAQPVRIPAEVAARNSIPALGPAAVIVPEPELPDARLAGADLRKRGLLMAGGAVAGFFVLVALAIAMSSRSMPNVPPAKKMPELTASAAPANPPATATATEASADTPSTAALAALRAGSVPAAPPAAEPAATAGANAEAPGTAENSAPVAPAQPIAPEPPANAAPAETTPVAIVAPAPAPAPAPPAEVHVRIAAAPSSARITMDGSTVSNPFDAHAPRGEHHRLQVEAPGHAPRDITLAFERDQKLTVKLERERAAQPARVSHPPAPKPSAPAHAAPAQLAITPRPAPISPPPAQLTITPRSVPPTPKPSTGKGAGFVNESPY
jgi:hypothetical protein